MAEGSSSPTGVAPAAHPDKIVLDVSKGVDVMQNLD
jgi:hypothetical protein